MESEIQQITPCRLLVKPPSFDKDYIVMNKIPYDVILKAKK